MLQIVITELMLSVGVYDAVCMCVECRLVCRNKLVIHSHSHSHVYIPVPKVDYVHSYSYGIPLEKWEFPFPMQTSGVDWFFTVDVVDAAGV